MFNARLSKMKQNGAADTTPTPGRRERVEREIEGDGRLSDRSKGIDFAT